VATTELETAALRPADIAGQRFTIGKRGYELEEVRLYLQVVADHLERLQGEVEWQSARVEHFERQSLAAKDSAYDRISREFIEVVRRADEAANHLMASAAEEAERLAAETTRRVERLVHDAGGSPARSGNRIGNGQANGNWDPPEARPSKGWGDRTEAAVTTRSISDSALAAFEELDLQFEGSTFDLFGEAGA